MEKPNCRFLGNLGECNHPEAEIMKLNEIKGVLGMNWRFCLSETRKSCWRSEPRPQKGVVVQSTLSELEIDRRLIEILIGMMIKEPERRQRQKGQQ